MGIMQNTLRSLFPRGSAWRLLGNIGAVVDGLGDSLERAHAFIRGILAELRPGSAVSTLPEWHTALGRRYDATMTVAFMQRMLAAVLTARGGVTLQDLNGQMHKELTAVNFSEIAYGGMSSIAYESECGADECNSIIAGTDANPGFYLVSGTVQDNNEAARVISVIGHYAPLHLMPTSSLIILSDTGTTESGLDTCGIAECNYAP
jgi:hypothetical protein